MTGAERHTASLSLFDVRRKLSLAATRADHLVVEFSDRAVARIGGLLRPGWAKRRFLQVVDELKPELILLHFADHIDNDALNEARKLSPGVVIADINIDPIDTEKNQRRLGWRKGVADALFVTTAEPALGAHAGERGFAAYLPNPVDTAIETGRGYDNDAPAFDLLFAASDAGLREMGDERLTPDEAVMRLLGLVPELRLSTPGVGGQPQARGYGYFQALASARAGWALSRRATLPLYASDRMVHFFGFGLTVLADRRAGFERFFGPDEAVFYDDLEGLAAAARRLKSDDAEARAIAKAGRERAFALFDSGRVLGYLLAQLFDDGGAQGYEWPCERWGS